jgi:hypothetical protein
MNLLLDPKWPQIDPRRVSEKLKVQYIQEPQARCLPGGGNNPVIIPDQ